jgi:hypothetical protein
LPPGFTTGVSTVNFTARHAGGRDRSRSVRALV